MERVKLAFQSNGPAAMDRLPGIGIREGAACASATLRTRMSPVGGVGINSRESDAPSAIKANFFLTEIAAPKGQCWTKLICSALQATAASGPRNLTNSVAPRFFMKIHQHWRLSASSATEQIVPALPPPAGCWKSFPCFFRRCAESRPTDGGNRFFPSEHVPLRRPLEKFFFDSQATEL